MVASRSVKDSTVLTEVLVRRVRRLASMEVGTHFSSFESVQLQVIAHTPGCESWHFPVVCRLVIAFYETYYSGIICKLDEFYWGVNRNAVICIQWAEERGEYAPVWGTSTDWKWLWQNRCKMHILPPVCQENFRWDSQKKKLAMQSSRPGMIALKVELKSIKRILALTPVLVRCPGLSGGPCWLHPPHGLVGPTGKLQWYQMKACVPFQHWKH